jgi:hypothetical protein
MNRIGLVTREMNKLLAAFAVAAVLPLPASSAQEAESAAPEVSAVAICRGPGDVVGRATVELFFGRFEEEKERFLITVSCAGRAACESGGNCRVGSATRTFDAQGPVSRWTADLSVLSPDGENACVAAGTSLPADVTCEMKGDRRYSVLLKIE